eukprot:7733152-Pyramimonas_sp.AAC.1
MLRSRTRLWLLGSDFARDDCVGSPILLEAYACPTCAMMDFVTFLKAGAVVNTHLVSERLQGGQVGVHTGEGVAFVSGAVGRSQDILRNQLKTKHKRALLIFSGTHPLH